MDINNRINYHLKALTGFFTIVFKVLIVCSIFFAGYSFANYNKTCQVTVHKGDVSTVVYGVTYEK